MVSKPHSPLLTLEQVMDWRDRILKINEARRVLDGEEAELLRKLEAVRVLFGDIPALESIPEEPISNANLAESDEQMDAESFLSVVLKAVEAIGGAPEPRAIRRWIASNGSTPSIRERADKQYFYTCLMRQANSGKLIKMGNGYSLPVRSPEGEAEGVVPSVTIPSALCDERAIEGIAEAGSI